MGKYCRHLEAKLQSRRDAVSSSVTNFCQACGGPLELRVPNGDTRERPICKLCGHVVYSGPALLILTLVLADRQVLLIKRGTPPYVGKWAPIGGYVEAGESLENAAIREVHEETGLVLTRDQLLPHGIISLPKINQIYAVFLAVLDEPRPLKPVPPEVLDARWFTEEAYPLEESWDPALELNVAGLYERLRAKCFCFYQGTDDSLRVIGADSKIEYLWRR